MDVQTSLIWKFLNMRAAFYNRTIIIYLAIYHRSNVKALFSHGQFNFLRQTSIFRKTVEWIAKFNLFMFPNPLRLNRKTYKFKIISTWAKNKKI